MAGCGITVIDNTKQDENINRIYLSSFRQLSCHYQDWITMEKFICDYDYFTTTMKFMILIFMTFR